MMKFQVMERFIGWAKYANYLGVSNFTSYTYPKFVEIDQFHKIW